MGFLMFFDLKKPEKSHKLKLNKKGIKIMDLQDKLFISLYQGIVAGSLMTIGTFSVLMGVGMLTIVFSMNFILTLLKKS